MLLVFQLSFYKDKHIIDPTNSTANMTSSYEQHWQILSETSGIWNLKSFDTSTNKTAVLGNISLSLTEISTISPTMKETKGHIYVYDGFYANSNKGQLVSIGRHYSDINKGFMLTIIPVKFAKHPVFDLNDTVQQALYDQAHDPSQAWPNAAQTAITQEQIDQIETKNVSAADCAIQFYYELSKTPLDNSDLTYPPDIAYGFQDFTETGNQKFYPKITSALVSQNCAFYFRAQGLIYNSAHQMISSFYYAIPTAIGNFLSILSGLRLLQLLQSQTRVRRISLPAILLITIFDFGLAFIHLTFSMAISRTSYSLVLCSVMNFISASFIDTTILSQVYRAYLARRGQQNNPRNLCKIVLIMYVMLFAYLILSPYLPPYGTFLLILAASSCWGCQLVHSFIASDTGKALPFDYIFIQSIVKYAPVIYFYCYKGNFMNQEVRTWYTYLGSIWCGTQILFILLQFFVGNRFGLKINFKKAQVDYNYADQFVKNFIIKDSKAFVDPQQLINQLQADNTTILVFLKNKILVSIQEYENSNLNAEETETTPLVNENISICMNPLHSHSLFYAPNLTKDQLSEVLEIPLFNKSSCFYAFNENEADNILICPICIDFIDLENLENFKSIVPFHSKQIYEKYEKKLVKPCQTLWIPPCGHCFHKECLSRWGNENLQCPVDRGIIPPVGEDVWYE
ncbi:RING-H2 zinc finger-containing protein [Spironucleus salmonicida]|uniref:RING-type E3 ubiquitin transferase n=1 Tax=Spironucleus salmonicida TaxID=348837 RepID=V6LR84_9EUKA|nr:RING-H2 zinc finger-containing protein [Spironucleus salmonicida]|eukprot:EST46758.1 RING-H2 zinc finger-containing protein [Spironucleus salmonicida]